MASSSSSYFQKTVTLVDWWLTKPQSDHHSQTLGVAGFTSQQNRPTRCFSSAPILKIFDLFELETVDGVCIILQGFINKDRTLLNGFSPQLFDHFIIGFPPNWNDYSPKLESASKSVSSLFFQQNDGKDSTQEYCLFHGKPQNSDGYDVDTGVKHCNDMMFNDKSSTLINPSSVEIPHEHIIEAGNEVLCERSPVTSEFKDDPSLEMGPTVSNTVDSSMRANCLGVSSRRMTRSVKKQDNSKNSFPVINDKSNLDKRTLIGPGTLGSSANLNKKAVNVVDCDMKSKSKSIESQSSGGNECERSPVTPEFKDDQSLEMSPIEHIIEAGNEVLCERSTVTPEFKDAPSLETSPIVSNTVESSTQPKFLGISSRRMTRSMKKLDNSKNSFPQINDISNLDKRTLIDPGILVSSENLNKKAVNVDCDMKSKSRNFDTKSSGGCGKGSNETVSCSEDSVIKMKLKRTPFDQNGDVITKDKRNKDDADVSGESQINMRITDVNDDIAIVKTNMKGCRNKKRNKVDMPQKEGLPATHGTSSKDTVMNGNRSKTKLPVKRKLISSPKAKSTSLRGKKGSKERNESANILSIESFSAKKSRSGRVVLPPLEFWRNQKVVYDEDREMCGVQEPK